MENKVIKPQEHQIFPINFLKSNYGILLYHTMGSGKTITALLSVYQFPNEIIIIGPKSSRKTFDDEILRLKLNNDRFTFYTFTKVKTTMYNDLEFFSGKSVIIDEAHHLRNEVGFLSSLLRFSSKLVLLTGTPVINYLNDLSPLINMIKKEDVLPTERELFEFFYFDSINMVLKNSDVLKKKIENCISYYKKNDGDYPKTVTIYKNIVMNGEQIDEYSNHVRRIIFDYQIPASTSLFNIKFDYLNRGKLNSFLSATRMISNIVSEDTPKIKELIKIVKEGPFPVLIYSNFLERGLYPVAKALDNEGITNKLITGKTLLPKLIANVNDYNSRKYDVLLLSSAGSESITLKQTRQVHIMEPHFNDAKINQVIGRAVRYQSHKNLPKDQQLVHIYRWCSIFPSNYNNMSADEYLIDLSRIKTNIMNAFESIIIDASIEKNIN